MEIDPGREAELPAGMRRFLVPCYLATIVVYLVISLHYFLTGLGGAMLLAVTLVPIAYVLWVLNFFAEGHLPYPRLGLVLNIVLACLCIAVAIVSAIYLRTEFDALLYERAGFFNTADKIIGALMLGLILEYTRREHRILFYLILFLMFYSVYGRIFPGIFGHPGISWTRVITSSTVEITLGMFGTYSQTGVGVIAAFFMFLGIAQGFGVQESIVKTFTGIFSRRMTLIPQTAVVTSMAIATCSGSGAANAAITGQYTIPLMKRAGFPALQAGAVEASASLGGLLMPPVMAIAGFIMADFLGVSYFEVIARGYAPALIFFGIISISVYLFTTRFVRAKEGGENPEVASVIERFTRADVLNTVIFFIFIGVLIYLMGVLWLDPSKAALNIALGLFITSSLFRIYLHPGTIREK
ncbi:MAG: TRAP transporter large permease subunit, partial [Deltaproteobacteria bacterium]|nr:TRAP transporter large permease subunit [Deltaproteobacteria bacterium]